MVIQHNLPAANTDRRLSVTTGELASSVEKLSSGYRINRAADDAAGLAISEKMRSQIRGLERASTNAQDGISLVQTTEGALNEVHTILQRMNELATQAANDTNTQTDRSQIQLEVDQLLSEIDRIHSTTQFNTINLLDGSFSGKNLQVGSLSGQKIEIGICSMSASALGLSSGTRTTTVTGSENVSAASVKKAANGATAATNDSSVTLTITDPSKITRDVTLYYEERLVGYSRNGNNSYSVRYYGWAENPKSTLYMSTAAPTDYEYYDSTSSVASFEDTFGVKYSYSGSAPALGTSAWITLNVPSTAANNADGTTSLVTSSSATASTDGISVMSFDLASDAMERIQSAIDIVSAERAKLGAIQNRLEHTVANLDTAAENATAAESRIRDTDMSDEMVRYSKNQILAEAGRSMLAQANQTPQGVLTLLA